MAVRRDIVVPIPKVNHITRERRRDGSTTVKYVLEAPYDSELGYTKPKRVTIGHVVPDSETEMYPTDGYREVFPDEWAKATGEEVPPALKRVGMRVALEAILVSTGMRECLNRAFGAPTTDAVLDYAMNAIINHADAACTVESGLAGQLPFSGEAHDESFYSSVFAGDMSGDRIAAFKREWARRCVELGAEEVWLCIGGCNDDDRESEGVEISEHATSETVSLAYAVTEYGLPVTFDEYQGGLVDAEAMGRIIDFLLEYGIRLCGVALDHGRCDRNVIRYLHEHAIPYVIMVKGTPEGLKEDHKEFGEKIKHNAEYLVEGTQLFAAQKEIRPFNDSEVTDHLTLFYDHRNASDRVGPLLESTWKDRDAVAAALAKGEADPAIPQRSRGVLSVENGEVTLDRSALQSRIDELGFSSIVSSVEMAPARMHALYACRSGSEKQYALLKAQLGLNGARMSLDASVHAKACCTFVACILRHELEVAARAVGSNVDGMIDEMNLIEAVSVNGAYAYTHSENEHQKAFLTALDITEARIDEVVRAENDRLSGRTRQSRQHKTGPKRDSSVVPAERKKPGPKPGFKRGGTNMDGSPRKKPGPKPGSKRGEFNADGSLRKKPGPKKGSHNVRTTGRQA